VSGDFQVKLRGRVLRLNPRRRIATVGIPSVGRGRSFRATTRCRGRRWLAPSSSATARLGASSARWSRYGQPSDLEHPRQCFGYDPMGSVRMLFRRYLSR
jgi:hypothetical protein